MKNNKAFTLVELLIVFVIIFILVGVIGFGIFGALLKGNYWFSEDSALKAIHFENPNIVSVVKIQRNVFDYSVIYVEDSDGARYIYNLDTNILWNHDVYLMGDKK